jgi:hypothetical protein
MLKGYILVTHNGQPAKIYPDGSVKLLDPDGTERDVPKIEEESAPPPAKRWHDPYA